MGGAGVFRHFQVIQHLADIAGELSHFLSNAASACGFDERNGETPQPGDVFRAISSANPAAVLVVVPVDDVMATVFDAPVPSVDGKDALRIGLFGSLTGYAVGDLAGVFACFLVSDFSLNTEYLSDMRKCKIVIQFWSSPDFSDFDSAVISRRAINKVGFLAVIEPEGNVLEKTGLIVFNCEVVMGMFFFDEVIRKRLLGQKGVACDYFSFNINVIKQWGGGLDFVCAFDLLFGYGDGSYFFWV